jgi:hypothetical protein
MRVFPPTPTTLINRHRVAELHPDGCHLLAVAALIQLDGPWPPDSLVAEDAASAVVSLAAGATELEVAAELGQTRWAARQTKVALRRWFDRLATRKAVA